MKVGVVFITTALMYLKTSNSTEVSSIDCGDVCSAINGSSYTLTCRLSGSVQVGIRWKRRGTLALSCDSDGACVSFETGYAVGRYIDSQTAQIKITSFSDADTGNWECSDGPGTPGTSKSCTLTPIAQRNIVLGASCRRFGTKHMVTCELDDHGTPPITLELKQDENIIDSTASEGRLSTTVSGAGMKEYTCAVTGVESKCATPKTNATKCDDIVLPCLVIVINISLAITVIVLLVIIKSGTRRNFITAFYIADGLFLTMDLLFIILLFALYNDYTDGLFISAAVFDFFGLFIGVVTIIILHVQ